MTDYIVGRVCERHPEEEGRRYASNRECPGCCRDRNRSPARKAYKAEYLRECREDPAWQALHNENAQRAERRGPRVTYSAAEYEAAQSRIRMLEGRVATLRARIAQLEKEQ